MTVSIQGMGRLPPHRLFLAGMTVRDAVSAPPNLVADRCRMPLAWPQSRCKFGAVNDSQATTWVEGTSADLVADALALGVKASTRMVTDWVSDGLLANPEPRKTSAHGSDPRVFPPEQRKLFTLLLLAREHNSQQRRFTHRSLIRGVLYLWLIDDTTVLTPQARRAWRSYARAMGRATAATRGAYARRIVDQLAHPAATKKQRHVARLVIEECELTWRIDFDRLTSVLTELVSPWPPLPGVPRIERALPGPCGRPATVQHFIALYQAKLQMYRRLRHEEIDESVLDRMRAVHRLQQPIHQAHVAAALAANGAEELAEQLGEPTEEVDGFVVTLAVELGLFKSALDAAETARLGRAR